MKIFLKSINYSMSFFDAFTIPSNNSKTQIFATKL